MKKLLLILSLFLFVGSLNAQTMVKYFESIAIDSVATFDTLGADPPLPPAGKVKIYARVIGGVYGFYILYSDGTRHNLDSANGQTTFVNVYGDASDGDTTIAGAKYTMSRDRFFDDLIVNAGDTINTNGFRLYVQDSLTLNGVILYNGNTGGNGGNASGATAGGAGAAGAAITANYFPSPGPGTAGLAGATTGAGSGGQNSSNVGNGIGNGGGTDQGDSAGGAGGAGASTGGGSGGGNGGNSLFSLLAATNGGVHNWYNASLGRAFSSSAVVAFQVNGNNPSGGSGGAGGTGTTGTRGAGGGSGGTGSNGGIISLNCKHLLGSGRVEAKGGDGGNGGNGGNATGDYGSGGGGAGGAGGNGGLIVFTFNDTSGWTGTFTVVGGNGGTKGLGGTGGNASGSDGHNGGSNVIPGIIFRFRI